MQADLDRRRPGQTHLTTPRDERDTLRVVSGLFDGSTTGSPLTIVFENQDTRSRDYQGTKDLFRPGHADYGYHMRYGVRDHRGGGRASARETISRVAAGAIGRQILQDRFDIDVIAWVSSIGSIAAIDMMEIFERCRFIPPDVPTSELQRKWKPTSKRQKQRVTPSAAAHLPWRKVPAGWEHGL